MDVFVQVRIGKRLAPYAEILATLLHELAHFEEAGHGIAFYDLLSTIVSEACSSSGTASSQGQASRSHLPGDLEQDVRKNIERLDGLWGRSAAWRAFNASRLKRNRLFAATAHMI